MHSPLVYKFANISGYKLPYKIIKKLYPVIVCLLICSCTKALTIWQHPLSECDKVLMIQCLQSLQITQERITVDCSARNCLVLAIISTTGVETQSYSVLLKKQQMFQGSMLIPVNDSGCVLFCAPCEGIFNEITRLDPVPHICCTRL